MCHGAAVPGSGPGMAQWRGARQDHTLPALFPSWLRADMAIFGCLLLGVACSFGQMTARAGVWSSPEPPVQPPETQRWWGLGGHRLGLWLWAWVAGPGWCWPRRKLLSVPTNLRPLTRVATLVQILQQVGGALRGGHLRGHHVPSHLVGRSYCHRRRPLPPALRDLQEARCAVSCCPGLLAPLLPAEGTQSAILPFSSARRSASGSVLSRALF